MKDRRRKDEEDLKTHRICGALHSVTDAVMQLDKAGEGHADDCACRLHLIHRALCQESNRLNDLIQARTSYRLHEV